MYIDDVYIQNRIRKVFILFSYANMEYTSLLYESTPCSYLIRDFDKDLVFLNLVKNIFSI